MTSRLTQTWRTKGLAMVVGLFCLAMPAQAAASGGLSGNFSGTEKTGGLTFVWQGTISFGRSAHAASGVYDVVGNGRIAWTLAGGVTGGCQYSGSGTLLIVNGMLAGHPVQGSAQVQSNGRYFVSLDTAATGGIPGYSSLPVTVSCPGTPPQTAMYGAPSWLDTGSSNVAHNGSLRGTYGFGSGGFSEEWTWDLGVSRSKLKANPGGPYTVLRGGTVRLDGRKSTPASTITSYGWRFAADNCPRGVRLDPEALKHGRIAKVVVLCSVKVTLTVSDGFNTASASTIINVKPRPWRTPAVQRPFTYSDPGFNPPPPRILSTSGGALLDRTLGLNVSACSGAADPLRREYEQLVCPLQQGGSWLDNGFELGQVNDPGGPFDGFYYVANTTFSVIRQGLGNHWLLPNAPADTGAKVNFYNYNAQHGTKLNGFLQALQQHEGLGKAGIEKSGHTLAMIEAMAGTLDNCHRSDGQPLDPRKFAEKQISSERSTLIDQVNSGVQDNEDTIYQCAKDPLPIIWSGNVWVWSPPGTGLGDWEQFHDIIGETPTGP